MKIAERKMIIELAKAVSRLSTIATTHNKSRLSDDDRRDVHRLLEENAESINKIIEVMSKEWTLEER